MFLLGHMFNLEFGGAAAILVCSGATDMFDPINCKFGAAILVCRCKACDCVGLEHFCSLFLRDVSSVRGDNTATKEYHSKT